MKSDSPVVVGRIASPYGIKGWVHVKSFTQPDDNLVNLNQLNLRLADGSRQTIRSIEFRRHNRGWIAQLNQATTRNEAVMFSGMELVVERSDLPELDEDEVYWIDLLGVSVSNKSECELGQVTEVFHNGASPILSVKGDGGSFMIPMVQELVIEVIPRQHIKVDWDESWTA